MLRNNILLSLLVTILLFGTTYSAVLEGFNVDLD